MAHIDSLEKISVSGGSDRYGPGTYKVSDKTLPAQIGTITISDDAVISALKEWRLNPDTRAYEDAFYVPRFLGDTLKAGQDYYFEYPITEITIDSGYVLLNFLPSGRIPVFTLVTTTVPPTTPAP